MAEAGEKSMECGFCLQKDSALVNPKLLPCSHVHCYGCLAAYFNQLHVVRCPTCKEVFDVTLDNLPVAELVEDILPACDTCTGRGVKDEPAETYCVTCSRKYCKRHREYHDELYDGHANISITEHPSKYRKLEVRTCTEHGLPLILGCKMCCTVVCAECTSDLSVCTVANRPHELIALNKLAKKITNELNSHRSKVMATEDKLGELFKRTSAIIADYETETEEMVERIHQRRDEQIETIREKYDSLEKELIELRAHCKSRMTRFMEDDVGVKLSNINHHRVEIEVRVKRSHQVDFITESKDIISEMMRLQCDGLPVLRIKGLLNTLNTKEEKREIELVVVSADVLISWEEGLTVGRAVLKSIALMEVVPLHRALSSVCHYQGNLYVALGDNTVMVVDDNREPKDSHITLSGIVVYVTVYKDGVYTLLHDSNKVHVHDLSGQIITSWGHTDMGSDNCLVGIADQIVIPDRTYGRLALYSLTGKIEKHIPCPLLHGDEVAICAINDDSVIVSNKPSNRVLRMNLSTGEVVWNSHVTNPTGVECYNGGSVLVATGEMGVIHILDIRTGNYMDAVTSDGSISGSIRNLCIFDDTLIITRYDDCRLLYYGIDNHKCD